MRAMPANERRQQKRTSDHSERSVTKSKNPVETPESRTECHGIFRLRYTPLKMTTRFGAKERNRIRQHCPGDGRGGIGATNPGGVPEYICQFPVTPPETCHPPNENIISC